jgi:hypothetical protein
LNSSFSCIFAHCNSTQDGLRFLIGYIPMFIN